MQCTVRRMRHSTAVRDSTPSQYHSVHMGHFVLGGMMHLAWPYFIGVAIAAATLVYQHRIAGPTDFSRVTQMYFMRNGIVSIAIFVFAWISYFV